MYPRALIALALLTSSAHAADLPASSYADPDQMTTGSISRSDAPRVAVAGDPDDIVTGSIEPRPQGLAADPVRDGCETNAFIRLLFGTGSTACLSPGGSGWDPARDNNDDTEVADSGGNGAPGGAGPGRDPDGGDNGGGDNGGGDPNGGDNGGGDGGPDGGGAGGDGDGGGHGGPCGCKP